MLGEGQRVQIDISILATPLIAESCIASCPHVIPTCILSPSVGVSRVYEVLVGI